MEPNIIQEVLLSKERNDFGEDFIAFEKILNRRTVDGKIEIEFLWDNREVFWEPSGITRKDDSITLSLYTQDNNLLDKRS